MQSLSFGRQNEKLWFLGVGIGTYFLVSACLGHRSLLRLQKSIKHPGTRRSNYSRDQWFQLWINKTGHGNPQRVPFLISFHENSCMTPLKKLNKDVGHHVNANYIQLSSSPLEHLFCTLYGSFFFSNTHTHTSTQCRRSKCKPHPSQHPATKPSSSP